MTSPQTPPSKRPKSNTSLASLPQHPIHVILAFTPTQRQRILLHHVCTSFYYCNYAWEAFYVPQRMLEERATGSIRINGPVVTEFKRHHPNAALVQHSDVLDSIVAVQQDDQKSNGMTSYIASPASECIEPFVQLNGVSAPPPSTQSASLDQQVHFAREFLSLSPHWNFEKCHTLILHQYNVFTIRIMEAFRIISPSLTSIRFLKVPLNYLTAQEIRRMQRRIQLLQLRILDEEKVLPMCKCKRMLAIQETGYCFACAPSLSEAANLAQRFLIEGGMKAVALQNYYYNE